MPSHYQEIYDAAKNRNGPALREALREAIRDGSSIDVLKEVQIEGYKIESIVISPICQLAIENNQKAVKFLIVYGADRDDALYGYAIGGHTDQVEAHLKQGDKQDAAVCGYAIGGHTDQVEALLEQGANQDAAVRGYAIGGHTDQVKALLEQGANQDAAVRIYTIAGNTDQVDLLLGVNLFEKISELRTYGIGLKKQGDLVKGEKAIRLANKIHKEVNRFILGNKDKPTASKDISRVINNGKKSMGEDRKAQDIIAHIVFALTGIGLIIILAKKFLTQSKSGFLNSTKRQKMTSDIEKEIQKIFSL